MTLLAPLWLALAAVAAAAVVALHLITTQRPPPAPFPTARFVPAGEARAAARASRPADLLLLALRVAAVLLLGVVAAQPVSRGGGGSSARVVVVDRSRSAGTLARDSALAAWHTGDALVLFDSAAHVVAGAAADSLRSFVMVGARGALSPALVEAVRAARAFAPRADSVELVLVSPVAADELDAATLSLASSWRGPVRVVRTPLVPVAVPAIALVSADADDPLRPAVDALNAGLASAVRAAIRVVRDAPTAADSAAARTGAALVHWPRTGDRRTPPAALWSDGATLVAPLADLQLALTARGGSHVVARWADGRPAAVESMVGNGCLRVVSAGLPTAGDVALQPAFLEVARRLMAPCARASTSAAASDSTIQTLQHRPTPSSQRAMVAGESAPVTPWLAALALLLLLAELAVRRRNASMP